jgi:hypothetical protein
MLSRRDRGMHRRESIAAATAVVPLPRKGVENRLSWVTELLNAPLHDLERELALERRRFGYRRLLILLRREGIVVNHKRLFRLYREERLTVRRRSGRKRALGTRAPMTIPQGPKRSSSGVSSNAFSVSPLRTVHGMGAGLPAGWLALSLAVAISPTPLGGLVRPARAPQRSGRPLILVTSCRDLSPAESRRNAPVDERDCRRVFCRRRQRLERELARLAPTTAASVAAGSARTKAATSQVFLFCSLQALVNTPLECAPGAGQNQAAGLTVCRVWWSSNWAGLR